MSRRIVTIDNAQFYQTPKGLLRYGSSSAPPPPPPPPPEPLRREETRPRSGGSASLQLPIPFREQLYRGISAPIPMTFVKSQRGGHLPTATPRTEEEETEDEVKAIGTELERLRKRLQSM